MPCSFTKVTLASRLPLGPSTLWRREARCAKALSLRESITCRTHRGVKSFRLSLSGSRRNPAERGFANSSDPCRVQLLRMPQRKQSDPLADVLSIVKALKFFVIGLALPFAGGTAAPDDRRRGQSFEQHPVLANLRQQFVLSVGVCIGNLSFALILLEPGLLTECARSTKYSKANVPRKKSKFCRPCTRRGVSAWEGPHSGS